MAVVQIRRTAKRWRPSAVTCWPSTMTYGVVGVWQASMCNQQHHMTLVHRGVVVSAGISLEVSKDAITNGVTPVPCTTMIAILSDASSCTASYDDMEAIHPRHASQKGGLCAAQLLSGL